MRLLTVCVAIIVSMFAPALYGEAIPYTNYEVDTRIEVTATGVVGIGSYTEVPWVWFSGPGRATAPFWNVNTTVIEEARFAGPPTLDADFVGTFPYVGTRTLRAHEGSNPDAVIGTMVWSLIGAGTVDFNASRAMVDEGTGVIMLKVGHPLVPEGQPFATYTFVEETGVFLDDGIVPVRDPSNPGNPSDSKTFYSGWFVLPLLPGVDANDPVALQENILSAPVIHSFGEGVWTGYYVPEPLAVALAALAFAGVLPLVWRRFKRSRV